MRRLCTLLLLVHSSLLFAAASSSSAAGSELEHREPLIGCAKSGRPVLDANKLLAVRLMDQNLHVEVAVVHPQEPGNMWGFVVASPVRQTAQMLVKQFRDAGEACDKLLLGSPSVQASLEHDLNGLTCMVKKRLPSELLKQKDALVVHAALLKFCSNASLYILNAECDGISWQTAYEQVEDRYKLFSLGKLTSAWTLKCMGDQELWNRGEMVHILENFCLQGPKKYGSALVGVNWRYWKAYNERYIAYKKEQADKKKPNDCTACIVQ